jgi:hypothetical protein
MKELHNITEEQAKHLCELVNEPYINMVTNSDGKWDGSGLEVQILTTSTLNGDRDDSCIWIYKDGTVSLYRNNGNWGGHRYEPINASLVTQYLRGQGYVFKGSKENLSDISKRYSSVIADIYAEHHTNPFTDIQKHNEGIIKAMVDFAIFYKEHSSL